MQRDITCCIVAGLSIINCLGKSYLHKLHFFDCKFFMIFGFIFSNFWSKVWVTIFSWNKSRSLLMHYLMKYFLFGDSSYISVSSPVVCAIKKSLYSCEYTPTIHNPLLTSSIKSTTRSLLSSIPYLSWIVFYIIFTVSIILSYFLSLSKLVRG